MASPEIFRRIFLILLLQSVVYSNWVDDLAKYIIEDSGCYQVYLVTNFEHPESELESRTIQDLFGKLMKGILTRRINVYNFEGMVSIDAECGHRMNTAWTFFVLVTELDDFSKTSQQLIKSAAEIAEIHYHSKYLFLSSVSRFSDTLERFVKIAWGEKKLLDFTIVEFIENLSETTKLDNSPVVHLLNPFKKEYKREKWPSNLRDLFPNKLNNMHGHNLRASPTIGKFTAAVLITGEIQFKIGTVMAERLNASLQIVGIDPFQFYGKGCEVPSENYHCEIYHTMNRYNSDIWLKPVDQGDRYLDNNLRTITIEMEQICTIVPKKRRERVLLNPNVLVMYGLYFCLVLTFWILKRMIGLNDRLWSIWNVCCILLGISVTRQPRRYLQRILFISLVVISVINSSTVYDALTMITVRDVTNEKYQSFEDLDDSGLAFKIPLFNERETFSSKSPGVASLKKRKVYTWSNRKCFAAAVRGDICATTMSVIKMWYKRLRDCHKKKLQYGEPCFWTSRLSFPVSRGSPYRTVFDALLLRMQETGIMDLIIETSPDDQSHKIIYPDDDGEPQHVEDWECSDEKPGNMSVLTQQLLIFLAIGYGVSIFVFLIEISPTLYRKYWTPRNWISLTRNAMHNTICKLTKRRKKNENIKKIIRQRKMSRRFSIEADPDELSEIRVLPISDVKIDSCTSDEIVSEAQ